MTNLIDFYTKVRQRTERICNPLAIEDYVPQVVEYASPPKWHLAHTSWFFEEMILKKQKNYRLFHPDFSYLFNSYYNTVGKRVLRNNRGNQTRPTVEEVYHYRSHVDEHMKNLLQSKLEKETHELVLLGLNHEQQHQELLITDLKYTLGHTPLFPVYDSEFSICHSREASQEKGWINIDEGVYNIGYSGNAFCYDNELEQHKVYLPTSAIRKQLVSNGEFIEFINDGGYEQFNYWLDEGWAWVNQHNISSPLYWYKMNKRWHQYSLSKGLVEINLDEVLTHISFYEAQAFACYKNLRLPTEFEWEIAAPKLSWGTRWEWTNSAYLPYPNYKIAPGAVGEYNGKFMINQMVLRGASLATAPNHSRITYRNFFHPHYQWQYSGIRLAK